MKLMDKLKNVFFEEVEEDEEEIEPPKTYARKVEVPSRKPTIVKEEEDEEEEEPEEKFVEEEEIKPNIQKEEDEVLDSIKSVPMMFDVDDFLEEENISYTKDNDDVEKKEVIESQDLYGGRKEKSYIDSLPTYSYTKKSYTEERQTKVFKPSPIISPIYGILDKNYRKEEVVTKRETRISGTYKKPDLDTVRNKAFKALKEEKEVNKYSFEEDDKVYDVNNSKPQVSKVTIADADEYYNDLGLAYNVDYSDASRKTNLRSAKYNNNNKEKKKDKKEVDDNLFDLIDSMYNKED